MRSGPAFAFAMVAALATPAAAEDMAIDAPAGSVADAAIAIARQTGTSIMVPDKAVSRRKAPRIRGRMTTREAVQRLARSVNARAVPLRGGAWRIEPAPRQLARKPAPKATSRSARQATVAPLPPPIPMPEIVVVASKRDTKLQDLPAQASILNGEELELGGVGGTERITQRIATVASTYLGSGRNKLFIRGIADSSFTGPTQATVGQYLGDMRLSYNAPDPDLRLSDLERVEVLEGPQGTLYGAGSLGGIIRMVPNSPDLDYASLRGTLGGGLTEGGTGSADTSVTANIPLVSNRAAIRVVADAATEGGYIDKPMLGRENVNRTDILAGRAMARVELAPHWTVDAIGLVQSTRADDSQYTARNGPPYESMAQVEEGFSADYRHAQLVVAGKIGTIHMRSTTGIVSQDLEERYDATAPGQDERVFTQRNHTEMLAHETRLWRPLEDEKPLGWLAGVSLIDNETQLSRSIEHAILRSATPGVVNTVTEATAYGEASLRLRQGLIASVGARYTTARLGGGAEDVPVALMIARAEVTESRTQSAFLPSVSLVAHPGPSTTLYARYQEGFRPGGLAIEKEFVRRFEQDHARAIEFGLRKGRPGRDPFDLAVNLSYTRWQDIQADFIDDFGLPSTANIGDGRVWSISATGGARLAPGLRITGGLTVNESHIDEPQVLAASNVSHVPNIARVSGRAGIDYSRPVGRNLDLDARLWASYIGKSRLGMGPELGDLQGDYLDSGATVRVGNPRVGATLSITNLADTVGNRFALGTPFAVMREQVTPLRPRSVRLGVDFSF